MTASGQDAGVEGAAAADVGDPGAGHARDRGVQPLPRSVTGPGETEHPGAATGEVVARFGSLTPLAAQALAAGRGRHFQRLEFIGDSLLELVLHAHSVTVGPGCPYCSGRADRFTTDAHLALVAAEHGLGDWLDWQASAQRLADMVEACTGATWVSGRWPQCVRFVDAWVHPLAGPEPTRLLHGGMQVHPQSPVRAREILGASILEAAASTAAYSAHPEGDEGNLSGIRARMLSTEHVMSRARDSHWVRRSLRTRHFIRDDIERRLAEDLLARGLASAVSIAWPLVS